MKMEGMESTMERVLPATKQDAGHSCALLWKGPLDHGASGAGEVSTVMRIEPCYPVVYWCWAAGSRPIAGLMAMALCRLCAGRRDLHRSSPAHQVGEASSVR